MVVEPLDAVVADRAVTAPAGSDDLAVGAQLCAVDYLEEVLEIDDWVLNVTWTGKRCQHEEDDAHCGNPQVSEDPFVLNA